MGLRLTLTCNVNQRSAPPNDTAVTRLRCIIVSHDLIWHWSKPGTGTHEVFFIHSLTCLVGQNTLVHYATWLLFYDRRTTCRIDRCPNYDVVYGPDCLPSPVTRIRTHRNLGAELSRVSDDLDKMPYTVQPTDFGSGPGLLSFRDPATRGVPWFCCLLRRVTLKLIAEPRVLVLTSPILRTLAIPTLSRSGWSYLLLGRSIAIFQGCRALLGILANLYTTHIQRNALGK